MPSPRDTERSATSGDPAALRDRVRARDPSLLDEAPLAAVDAHALLSDPDARVRERAAMALAASGIESAPALRARTGDEDPGVRAAALAALVVLGRTELLPEIVKALRSDDPRVVIGAAVVLGRVGDRAAVPNLVAAFETEDEAVGAAVAWALGRLGDRAVVPWLVAALEQGFAAAASAEALGRLQDPRGHAALLGALSSANELVRAAAARALGRIAGVEDVPRLRLLESDPSARVRLAAAVALWERGEGEPAHVERALAEPGDP